jgi:hypothetical protein
MIRLERIDANVFEMGGGGGAETHFYFEHFIDTYITKIFFATLRLNLPIKIINLQYLNMYVLITSY